MKREISSLFLCMVMVVSVSSVPVQMNDDSSSISSESTSYESTTINVDNVLQVSMGYPTEFVIIGGDDGLLYYFPSNGDGSFGAMCSLGHARDYAAVVGYVDFANVAIADFDNDGDLDFVAGTGGNLKRIYMFTNDGQGNFNQTLIYELPCFCVNFYQDFATADFDDDGFYDFVASGSPHSKIFVFINNCDETFTIVNETDTSWFGGESAGIDTGDFNEDGKMDFLVTDYGNDRKTQQAHLYLGKGNGNFELSKNAIELTDVGQDGKGELWSVAAGDFNNDGHLDAIVGQDDDYDPGQTYLFIGDGSGNFSYWGEAYDLYPSVESGEDLEGKGYADAFDFDHDGNLDVVCADRGSETQYCGNFWFVEGNGDGSFQTPTLVYNFGDSMPVMGISAPPCRLGKPIADAGGDLTINEGEEAIFNVSGSFDPDGYIVKYEFDFGDGTNYVWDSTLVMGSDILVYVTTAHGSYNRSDFANDLPQVLASEGFNVVVTGMDQTGEITSELLDDFDQLWIMSTNFSSTGVFSDAEINAILNFQEKGGGLLIMADHTYKINSCATDANQISTNYGVWFFGDINHGHKEIYPFIVSHPLSDNISSIWGHWSEAEMTMTNPNVSVIAVHYGSNMIAVLDEEGEGRVVFDTSFVRMLDSDDPNGHHILCADNVQYAKNIAKWLGEGFAPESPPLINHTYGDDGLGTDGIYTVTLTVTDNESFTATDTCIVTVNNVAPIIDPFGPFTMNEGLPLTITTTAHDPGSDDLIFTWNFEYGSVLVNSHFNDGIDPDPYPSPHGTYPCSATDIVEQIYGDDGVYNVTLTVEDDDGGTSSYTTEITVNNLPPIINSITAPPDNEGSPITFTSTATDPGSDDLTFTWDWGDGTSSTTNTYYNNGVSPDPSLSPLGTYPFTVTDTILHSYGDNGVYTITLSVTDDDGGTTFTTTDVVVNNVAPIITLVIAPSGDEGLELTFEAESTDPGSDDLTFSWVFECGPTIVNTYYNNNATPDPPISPLGVYPFNISDTVTHIYGDNYNYTLVLTVTDDDGGTAIYTTTVSVDNVAPSIIGIRVPIVAYEGQSEIYGAVAYDEGSDDLTFEWYFGDSTPIITNTYYNNGNGTDPYPSPDGTFPFYVSDNLNHTFGDDYNYTLTLKVIDDDGGITTFSGIQIVYNVAPIIEPFGPFTVDEGSPIGITAISTDPGSDDLIFTWKLDYGPMVTNVYYNNGSGPDPYPSPWGIYPFSATNMVSHTYGDNGVFTVTLNVEDDDGGSTTYITNITVNNVDPTISTLEAYMNVNFTLRVAGEKWHSVNMTLFEDDIEIWSAGVTRQPGSPDEQAATLSGYKINIGSCYWAVVDYLPNDPRVNGNVWGANPIWIILEFQDGTTKRLHHTFNVRKSYWDSDHWNHIDPWEVDLTGIIYRQNITFKANATDPGSDDITFDWDFGDGETIGPNIYFNNGMSPDPYPSPEINPINMTDTVMHAFIASGTYTVDLIVSDDDSGFTTRTLVLVLPG